MREGSSLQNENKLQNGIVCVVAQEKEDLERSKARKLVSAKPGGPGVETSISCLGMGINGKSCRACPDPGPSWGPLGAGDTFCSACRLPTYTVNKLGDSRLRTRASHTFRLCPSNLIICLHVSNKSWLSTQERIWECSLVRSTRTQALYCYTSHNPTLCSGCSGRLGVKHYRLGIFFTIFLQRESCTWVSTPQRLFLRYCRARQQHQHTQRHLALGGCFLYL